MTTIEASQNVVLSFVIPCLNESLCLEGVLIDCHQGGDLAQVPYEVIVADNGSIDGSQSIALENGARLVEVPERGYGAALLAGIKSARGQYVIMGDADRTYNFKDASLFLEQLALGADLVMGNRFLGCIEAGAMPFMHRWVGNPVLSGIGKLLFGISVGDFHCGLRAFKKAAIDLLSLKSSGMEFASEMVIKASLRNYSLVEVPTSLSLDHPDRKPHLRTWRDGWRHLKFMLSFSPKYSFLFFALSLFILALFTFALFAFDVSPANGPNTLIISFLCLFSSLFVFSDYLTTRAMFADTYGKPSLLAIWFSKIVFRKKVSVDTLYQVSACGLILGLIVFSVISLSAFDSTPSSKLDNITVYFGSFLLSTSLASYLTAAKISTVRSLRC